MGTARRAHDGAERQRGAVVSAAAQLLVIAVALLTIVVSAFGVAGALRVFLIGQAIYWAMSYLARPLVLLTVQPQPRFGDSVADPRLADLGYAPGLAAVLRPVTFGMVLYAALVVLYVLWARGRHAPPHPPTSDDPNFVPALWAAYALGGLARLASVAGGTAAAAGEVHSANPVLNLFTVIGTIGALGLIIFVRPARGSTAILVIAALLLGELLWTVAIESKTPILGAAMAIAVRWALTGWTRAKVAAVLAISVAGIGGFGWLQSLKATPYGRAEAALADSSYPPGVRPFLSLLRRFDLVEAATDAYYRGPGTWLSPGEVLRYSVQSLIPNQLLGAQKFQSGTAWAQQVRGASVDMSQISVSLAEGNVNEGYVVGGYLGVAIGTVCTFILLLVWSRALYARSLPPVLYALALIEVPVVFERGILGSAETLGKHLQAVVLVWLIYLVVVEVRQRTPDRYPRIASAGR